MLGRAADKAAAANRQSGVAARNGSLTKQLFPSSSPVPSTTKNASITDMLKGPKLSRSPSGSAGPTRPVAAAKAPEPLQSRPLNTVSREPSQFASLYTSSDPFKEPDHNVIDLTENRRMSVSGPYGSHSTSAPVYISDGDFSDDDNLDFEGISSLPALPPTKRVLPVSDREPPPGTNTSSLSWSQSSISHYQPPTAVKRESPDDHIPVPQAAKKVKREAVQRQLPWQTGTATPNPPLKAKKEPPQWELSIADAKAQKKQLKTQQKTTASAKAEMVEGVHQAMKSQTTKKKGSAIDLSLEQEHVKSMVIDKGQSVFFTGPAGTGKSVLMRAIIAELKKKYARDPERIAVTASTGLAACNIGGMTLHSFSGIGLGKEDAQALVKKIRRNPKAKNRWLKTKVLIIDEISMVDGDLFDKLSQIGRIIRNNGRPWGGIQLVITGDFFQLPPVPDGNKQRDVKFAFDAATWNMSIDHTIGLTQVFRQKDPGM